MSTIPTNGIGQDLLIDSCPYYLIYYSPAVTEALQAYRWFETGQLALKFPRGLPYCMIDIIEAISNGYNRADKDHHDEIRSKNKRKSGKSI